MYGYNNFVLIISTLIGSRATHSFISKSIVQKLNLPLVLGKKLGVLLVDGLEFTCEEEVDDAYGIIA